MPPSQNPGNVIRPRLPLPLRKHLGSSDGIIECVEQTMRVRLECLRCAVAGERTAFEEVGDGLADHVESQGVKITAWGFAGYPRNGPWLGEAFCEALVEEFIG